MRRPPATVALPSILPRRKISLLAQIFFPKVQFWGLKILYFDELRSKIEILSTSTSEIYSSLLKYIATCFSHSKIEHKVKQ